MLLFCAVVPLAAVPSHAQRLIERTPNLPNSVTALPGMLELSLTHRFTRVEGVSGIASVPTFDVAFGMPFLLPVRWTAGVRYSPAGLHGRDEWEAYDRVGPLRQASGAPFDLNATGAYNFGVRSLDLEASLARRAGPLRVIVAGRAMTSAYGGEEARFAFAGGVAWHAAPQRTPLVFAADAAVLADRREGEEVAWSAAVQTGLPHTTLSLSLHATNTSTTSLQGASRGTRRTRWGLELNAPVEFAGFLLGIYASRERGRRSVDGGADTPAAQTVRISQYLYVPATLRIRVGDVVEWVNQDAAVHTVTSENGGFDSGGLQAGERWRARFDEPGVYPYYCGPHPFMKGVVVVR